MIPLEQQLIQIEQSPLNTWREIRPSACAAQRHHDVPCNERSRNVDGSFGRHRADGQGAQADGGRGLAAQIETKTAVHVLQH